MIFKQLPPFTAAESRVSHDPDEHTLSLMSSKVMCRVYAQIALIVFCAVLIVMIYAI